MDDVLAALKTAIVEGDDAAAAEHTRAALAAGIAPQALLDQAILPGIERTGELWKANQYFLPDVVLSVDAFKAALAQVEPLLRARTASHDDTGNGRRVVLGVVAGDMHELGKSLVVALLTAGGFDVTDLGTNVPAERFVAAVREQRPAIVGIGAYMTTTMLLVPDVIAALDRAGLRAGLRVMVGGVPTSQAFADEVGADAWGRDALDAVHKARALVEA